MTVRVEVEVAIERPLPEVFDFITNFENNPQWQSGMKSCEFSTEPPLRVGSKYKQVASFLGRRIVSEFEVLEYTPNRMVYFHSISGTFPIRVRRRVEQQGSSTLVTAIIEGEPNGWFNLFSPFVHRMMQNNIENDYQRLKTLLETK